jgi:hypothetical protein
MNDGSDREMSHFEVFGRWVMATCLGALVCWLLVYSVSFLYAVLPYGSIAAMERARSGSLGAFDILLLALVMVLLLFGLFLGFAQRRFLTAYFDRGWIGAIS